MSDGRQQNSNAESDDSSDSSSEVPAASYGIQNPDYDNPVSNHIHAWCQTAEKTVKAIRVYESNNKMLKQFIDRAVDQLHAVHEEIEEFTLGIREDRFCFGADVVYENSDRQYGIPFLLYRNAIRRITFTRGFDRKELIEFLKALTTDYNTFEYAGEDLVTILWRLRLPHLKYFAVEALSVAADSAESVNEQDKEQVEQIQNEVDGLVATIYGLTASDDDDIVESVAITKEDLEALKDLREESEEDLDLLDSATSRVLAAIPSSEFERLQKERTSESHQLLLERLIDILVELLFQEKGGKSFAETMDLIQKLMDAVLFAGRYDQAKHVVTKLRHKSEKAEDIKDMHVSRHLLKALALPSSISPLLSIVDSNQDLQTSNRIFDYLRSFDQFVTGTIVSSLAGLLERNVRKNLVDLIQEIGLQDPSVLETEMEGAKPVVMMDFLNIAEKLTEKDRAPLILMALEEHYPPLRIQALSMLRTFPKGAADEILTSTFSHTEQEVRLRAFQVAAARRSAAARSTLRLMLLSDEIWSVKTREIRTMTAAYAAIAEEDAVLILSKLLHPGFFSKKNIDVQVAAAFALAQIDSKSAKEQLKKGGKSLNGKVREACKRAQIDGAGNANIATFLGDELVISGFVDLAKDGEDVLKLAQDERRKQKNLATTDSEEMSMVLASEEAEDEDDRSDEELFANVLKPHDSPDFMPANLMAAPTEKVSVGGKESESPKTAPATASQSLPKAKAREEHQEALLPDLEDAPSFGSAPELPSTPPVSPELSTPAPAAAAQAPKEQPVPDLADAPSLGFVPVMPSTPSVSLEPSTPAPAAAAQVPKEESVPNLADAPSFGNLPVLPVPQAPPALIPRHQPAPGLAHDPAVPAPSNPQLPVPAAPLRTPSMLPTAYPHPRQPTPQYPYPPPAAPTAVHRQVQPPAMEPPPANAPARWSGTPAPAAGMRPENRSEHGSEAGVAPHRPVQGPHGSMIPQGQLPSPAPVSSHSQHPHSAPQVHPSAHPQQTHPPHPQQTHPPHPQQTHPSHPQQAHPSHPQQAHPRPPHYPQQPQRHPTPPFAALPPVPPSPLQAPPLPSGREVPKRSLSEDFRHRSKRPSKADSTNKDNLYSVAGEYEKKGDDS